MSKHLTTILLDTEDVIRAIEPLDYSFAGELRATFTKKRVKLLRVSPSSKTEFVYEERVKPNEGQSND